jgi:SpoVK/Ycf46/Vps4 family AAA+-type ATPase
MAVRDHKENAMPIQRRRRSSMVTQTEMPLPIILLWLYRMIVPLGGHREFVQGHGFSDTTLAATFGVADDDDAGFDPRTALSMLRKQHADAEKSLHKAKVPFGLSRNVQQLAAVVGMNDIDCRILEFAVLLHNERLLDDTADMLGYLPSTKAIQALSVILGIEGHLVRQALSKDGVLTRCGLVTVDHGGSYKLRGKLNLLSQTFADRIIVDDTDPVDLLGDVVRPAETPLLSIADYEHVAKTLDILVPYLTRTISTCRKGVNILIHGAPGTGKTQLARVLATELSCQLYEVANEDADGDPIGGMARLRAFNAAQSLFSNRHALLLFDEIEDVFDDGDGLFGRRSSAQTKKAWVNRTLEMNAVPTFWLSNSVRCLDQAFVRRFDVVLELPVPPKRQLQRIARAACGDLLDDEALGKIVASAVLAPAVLTRAASVVRCIGDTLGDQQAPRAIELLVSSTLQAQGHPALMAESAAALPQVYDPDLLHTEVNLVDVARGIAQTRTGRLCLYGPPGTGKTAYARWLAEQMDLPLHAKRASDLLSMYVGGTEKNIARAFRDAREEGALLLIDEADSFLQDRRGARHSWEITGVNEMLVQLESFAGIFVASTNLMTGLDQAALRRFDLKVRFDYLRVDQAWQLLERHCAALNLATPPESLRARLGRQSLLTPGDFATVVRQHRFQPLADAHQFVEQLERECLVKEGGARGPLGFV